MMMMMMVGRDLGFPRAWLKKGALKDIACVLHLSSLLYSTICLAFGGTVSTCMPFLLHFNTLKPLA